jgi:hypothetical protein
MGLKASGGSSARFERELTVVLHDVNIVLIRTLQLSYLTIGKIVAKTLISSDFGVTSCVQSSCILAMPIIAMRL